MAIICAIHQPNFFPWMGYFDKINRADIFVFLDDVQIQKTGGSWVNRTKLNCHGKEKWVTCPIVRPSGTVKINQVELSDPQWLDQFLDILTNYYKKYSRQPEITLFIAELLRKNTYRFLAELNRDIIISLSEYLGYKTQFILQSDLSVDSTSTEMLVDICRRVGADIYLCGGGATGYQDDDLFKEAGLDLEYQNYQSKPYGNPEHYLPGLSIIDYLMST